MGEKYNVDNSYEILKLDHLQDAEVFLADFRTIRDSGTSKKIDMVRPCEHVLDFSLRPIPTENSAARTENQRMAEATSSISEP